MSTGFAFVAIALFIMAASLHAHLSPYYHVNMVPPEGLEDTYFKGQIKFYCPGMSYEFKYSLVTPLTSLQLLVEGRSPIDLCRPTAMSMGDAPVCPNNLKGILMAKKLPLIVCQQIKDSPALVRIIPGSTGGPQGVATIKNHATA